MNIQGLLAELKTHSPDFKAQFNAQSKYNGTEVGVKNEANTNFIKLHDSGDLDVSTGNLTGISLNKQYKTVNLYGRAVNTYSDRLNINTKDQGLALNGFTLSPNLYRMCDNSETLLDNADLRLHASVRYWKEEERDQDNKIVSPAGWARKDIDVQPFTRYKSRGIEEGFEILLKEKGIY